MGHTVHVASPPFVSRVLSVVSRHRLASGIAAIAAAAVITAAALPSLAATNAAASSSVVAEDPGSPSGAPATPVPDPSADPSAATATPAPGEAGASTAQATEPPKPKKPKKPKPASATHKAKHVPEYPRDKHKGKRIVYDKALMTVWLMSKNNKVVARYPVVGRFDRPVKGVYRVYSKSPHSGNPFSKVTFNWMVRFAWGLDSTASIGFHDIPKYYDGTMMHSQKQLGLAIARGGCVRLAPDAARHIYRFADVGTKVVVLPSP